MSFDPQTLEEATKKRYGVWAGRPKGSPYSPEQCAFQVFPGRSIHYQCVRKPGHGIAKLYCKQHAQKVEERTR